MNSSTDPMHKTTQGIMQACELMNGLAHEAMDVAMKSMSTVTKGMDETVRSSGGLLQESFARAITAGKSMMSAKDMNEIMNMHNEFMKDCFDCWIAGTGKITEISARVTKEAIEPMAKHANDAMEKMMRTAKAG
jgi:phasin family protein